MADHRHTDGLVTVSEAMRKAMAEHGFTFRSLEKHTAAIGIRGGRGLTSSYMGAIARGEQKASIEALAGIAAALDIDPNTIAEYRLALTRRLFDERPPPFGVGLEQAIANLELYETTDTLKRLGDAADPPGHASEDGAARPATADGPDLPGSGTAGSAR